MKLSVPSCAVWCTKIPHIIVKLDKILAIFARMGAFGSYWGSYTGTVNSDIAVITELRWVSTVTKKRPTCRGLQCSMRDRCRLIVCVVIAPSWRHCFDNLWWTLAFSVWQQPYNLYILLSGLWPWGDSEMQGWIAFTWLLPSVYCTQTVQVILLRRTPASSPQSECASSVKLPSARACGQ